MDRVDSVIARRPVNNETSIAAYRGDACGTGIPKAARRVRTNSASSVADTLGSHVSAGPVPRVSTSLVGLSRLSPGTPPASPPGQVPGGRLRMALERTE